MNPDFMTASQRERFAATGSCTMPSSTPKKNNPFKKVLAVTAVTAAIVAAVAVAVKIDSNN